MCFNQVEITKFRTESMIYFVTENRPENTRRINAQKNKASCAQQTSTAH